MTKDIQHDYPPVQDGAYFRSPNFNYGRAYEIANLTGYWRNSSLRSQNSLIRTAPVPRTGAAGITVFSSAQGSDHLQWTDDFYVDSPSLLETLRRHSQANIYRARATFYAESNITRHNFSVNINHTKARFRLHKIELNEQGTGFDVYTQVERIRDLTRHNIIIWDTACSTTGYHNHLYNQLNAVLTQILYYYYRSLGIIPRVNMISHSTGGVLNMMWANRHPRLVCSLFAMGAPFNGTATGDALYLDQNHPNK